MSVRFQTTDECPVVPRILLSIVGHNVGQPVLEQIGIAVFPVKVVFPVVVVVVAVVTIVPVATVDGWRRRWACVTLSSGAAALLITRLDSIQYIQQVNVGGPCLPLSAAGFAPSPATALLLSANWVNVAFVGSTTIHSIEAVAVSIDIVAVSIDVVCVAVVGGAAAIVRCRVLSP